MRVNTGQKFVNSRREQVGHSGRIGVGGQMGIDSL
jgi:hypothetical protein